MHLTGEENRGQRTQLPANLSLSAQTESEVKLNLTWTNVTYI